MKGKYARFVSPSVSAYQTRWRTTSFSNGSKILKYFCGFCRSPFLSNSAWLLTYVSRFPSRTFDQFSFVRLCIVFALIGMKSPCLTIACFPFWSQRSFLYSSFVAFAYLISSFWVWRKNQKRIWSLPRNSWVIATLFYDHQIISWKS